MSALRGHSFILNAAEDFGGMRLESAEEAEEWVKYILGQSPGPDGPIKVRFFSSTESLWVLSRWSLSWRTQMLPNVPWQGQRLHGMLCQGSFWRK